MSNIDFATFCYKGDAHRLHAPGQLRRQVESNNYQFNKTLICYQECNPLDYEPFDIPAQSIIILNVDNVLRNLGVDVDKSQYVSQTDKAHHWKYHVVNHLRAAYTSNADYIVFADNDCWMVKQPGSMSWVNIGVIILSSDPEVFIVSPNDGERERKTMRFSQQMFMASVNKFRDANFNQPGWDGNINIPGGPMPEYWGMLEGRMELYCRTTGQCRYVLGPEYRYWHHNRLTKDGYFETDYSKY